MLRYLKIYNNTSASVNKIQDRKTSVRYFLNLVSRKDGHLFLPLEIRYIIWNATFPVIILKCKFCQDVLLTENVKDSDSIETIIYEKNKFTIIDNTPVCMSCITKLRRRIHRVIENDTSSECSSIIAALLVFIMVLVFLDATFFKIETLETIYLL
jgi:hypothetical protein